MKKQVLLYTLFILFLFFTSCITVNSETGSEKSWDYKIEITNPGTRSEGKIGKLYYNDNELKPYFEFIIIQDVAYFYQICETPWDFCGYIIKEDSMIKIDYCGENITKNERDTGFYYVSAEEKKNNTPPNWVWIKNGTIEAFIDPDKINFFVEKHDLHTIVPKDIIPIKR